MSFVNANRPAKVSMSHRTIDAPVEEEITEAEVKKTAAACITPEFVQNLFKDPSLKTALKKEIFTPLVEDFERILLTVMCQKLCQDDTDFCMKIGNLLANWEARALDLGTERSQAYVLHPRYKELSEESQKALAQNYATYYAEVVKEIQGLYRKLLMPT